MVGVAFGLAVMGGCGTPPPDPPDPPESLESPELPRPALPDGVREVDLAANEGADPFGYWARSGFVRMDPAVQLTQPAKGQVQIWLRLPPEGEGDALQRIAAPDGRQVLAYPPGTVADRVETFWEGGRERVGDVRGTRIDATGQRLHHVYRVLPDRDAPLAGVEWPAERPELHTAAVAALMDRLTEAGIGARSRDNIASKLGCDGCHQPMRPENRTQNEHGLVARGTDAAGFFTPSTVLDASTVLEPYGARDPNLGNPYLDIACPDGDPIVPDPAPNAHPRCPDGAVPRGTFDLATALAAGDAHAERVCSSWRTLVARLGAPPTAAHPCDAATDGGGQ